MSSLSDLYNNLKTLTSQWFYDKDEADDLLDGKADSSHTHSAATTGSNGFLSSTDKTKLDSISHYYGTCDVGANVAHKIVTCSSFVLETGATISVRFTYSHSGAYIPYLNVNNTGAIAIKHYGETLLTENAHWVEGQVVTFVYDGTYWIIDDFIPATANNYGKTMLSSSVSSNSTTLSATPYAVKTAYDLANSKADTSDIPTSTSELTNDGEDGSDAYVEWSDISTAGRTGSYNDLTNTPTIANHYYGTCDTAGGTSAKEVTCSDFTTLETGAIITVYFTNANTYNGTATLNVNGTGAKNIAVNGTSATSRYHWIAKEMVTFAYNGTYWFIIDSGIATTTYYGITKLTNSVSSTSTTTSATPYNVKQAYDLANGKADASHTHTASDITDLSLSWETVSLSNMSGCTLYVNDLFCCLLISGTYTLSTSGSFTALVTGTIPSDYRPTVPPTSNGAGTIQTKFKVTTGGAVQYYTPNTVSSTTHQSVIIWPRV